MCSHRYKLLPDSQQRELPLAKDEKLVSWEEIIFREETDSIPCTLCVNSLLPLLPGAAMESESIALPPALEQHCSWLFASTLTSCWMVLDLPLKTLGFHQEEVGLSLAALPPSSCHQQMVPSCSVPSASYFAVTSPAAHFVQLLQGLEKARLGAGRGRRVVCVGFSTSWRVRGPRLGWLLIVCGMPPCTSAQAGRGMLAASSCPLLLHPIKH